MRAFTITTKGFLGREFLCTKGPEDRPWKPAPEHLEKCHNTPLVVGLKKGRALCEDVWVNLAELQTIRNAQEVAVGYRGNLADGDFARLKDVYIVTQICIVNTWQERPRVPLDHLLTFGLAALGIGVLIGWLFC